MRVLGTDVDLPRALLVGLASLVALTLVLAGLFSTAAFGAYNPNWDGTSDLRALADDRAGDTVIARDVGAYGDTEPDETVAFVLSPTEAYTANETNRLRTFADRGGTLVVAGDFGSHENPLLAGLGVETRLNGTLVRDERFYYRSPALPTATNVSANHTLASGVEQVTLNYGTVLEPGPNATVLVGTSAFAYLDTNASGELEDNETVASYPVVAVEAVGEGRVVVVSDPSVFLNAMLERPGNRAFATNFVDGPSTVLFDLSHTTGVPPLAAAVLILRESPLALAATGSVAVVGLALWGRGRTAWVTAPVRRRLAVDRGDDRDTGTEALDTEEVVDAVKRQHPDWDPDRVERVAQEINRRRQNERIDERT
ncbi:DUF4350 domain-containing protein [Salinirussus salinus]|uniref:DUF4350 domain-containing protein n=1 Tax=Salinirussus salinus TaxID=1198300 RepID=UPI00135C2000|nr:DUF4350 domain-containing protein [Salinirussus salinus]